jgi:hypothetical protein
MRVLAQTQVVALLSLRYKHTGNRLHFKLLRSKMCWAVRNLLKFVAYFTHTNRITGIFYMYYLTSLSVAKFL